MELTSAQLLDECLKFFTSNEEGFFSDELRGHLAQFEDGKYCYLYMAIIDRLEKDGYLNVHVQTVMQRVELGRHCKATFDAYIFVSLGGYTAKYAQENNRVKRLEYIEDKQLELQAQQKDFAESQVQMQDKIVQYTRIATIAAVCSAFAALMQVIDFVMKLICNVH